MRCKVGLRAESVQMCRYEAYTDVNVTYNHLEALFLCQLLFFASVIPSLNERKTLQRTIDKYCEFNWLLIIIL